MKRSKFYNFREAQLLTIGFAFSWASTVIDNWLHGRRGICDVSITHPWVQAACSRGGEPEAERAAKLREDEKNESSVTTARKAPSSSRW